MIIIDDAVDDPDLVEKIQKNLNIFPKPKYLKNNQAIVNYIDSLERTTVDYYFWHGWNHSPADTLKKSICQHIWKKYLPFPERDLFGFEYWTRTFLPGQYSDWHVDRGFCTNDIETDKEIYPRSCIGSVYYPPIYYQWEETYLEIRYEDYIDKILCKPNRLVIFDGSNLYHKTTPTNRLLRYSMAMNIWSKNDPPTQFKNFIINSEPSSGVTTYDR